MQIGDLRPDDASAIEQTVRLLFEAFRGTGPWLPDLEAARAEVLESFGPGRLSRIARA